VDWERLTTFGDVVRAAAAAVPEKIALIGGGRAATFASTNARMNQLAHGLSDFGLKSGDRIAVLSRNRPEVFEAYGSAKVGIAVMPLNCRHTHEELLHTLRDGEPVAILAESAFAGAIDKLRAHLPFVRHYVQFDDAPTGWLSYEALLAQASPEEPIATVAPDDLLCLMYTSGTTGRPKGAMLTHGGLVRNCRIAIDSVLGLREADVALAVMPLFHVGGLWYHLFPAFARGCTTVLLSEFQPDSVLAALQQYGVTISHFVPTMVDALVNHPDATKTNLSRLRIIYYAASTIPAGLLRQAMATFSQCDFLQGYGSTEGGMITSLTAEDHRYAIQKSNGGTRLLTCGRPLHCQLRIVDTDQSGIGEIVIHSNRTMAGYWHNPEATRAAMHNGWFRTGDLGMLDANGYLTIADRKHDLIVSGGENVYPREVEDALTAHPTVIEAAVFGLPDPHWVEKVAAAVVLRPGVTATPEELRRHARQRLAGYKCPKTIFLCDSLPKNAAGKVLKKDLRHLYAGG